MSEGDEAKGMPHEHLLKLVRYEPETGTFFLLPRSADMFAGSERAREECCVAFNQRWADKPAGWRLVGGAKRKYKCLTLEQKNFLAHRLAWFYMTKVWPPNDVDHINGDSEDNRWANLRLATRGQNLANSKPRTREISKWRGVVFHKTTKKWHARIKAGGKQISLGYYDCPAAASFAYQVEQDKRFGEYARWD